MAVCVTPDELWVLGAAGFDMQAMVDRDTRLAIDERAQVHDDIMRNHACPDPQGEHGRCKDQCQDGRDAEAKDHGGGKVCPPLCGRAVDCVAAADEIERQGEHHRGEARHRGQRSQQNRTDPVLCRAHDGLDTGHIPRIFLISVDQHDVVVHHDPSKGHDPGPGHDHAKGHVHDK